MPDHSFEQDVIDRLARIETHLTGLPERVSSLERFRAWTYGGLGVFSLLITGVIEIFIRHKGA